jgi:hypothetical protein
MSDKDGPIVAGHFYQELFKDNPIDSTQAASALHKAVTRLRAQRVSLARWATFIHIGA